MFNIKVKMDNGRKEKLAKLGDFSINKEYPVVHLFDTPERGTRLLVADNNGELILLSKDDVRYSTKLET